MSGLCAWKALFLRVPARRKHGRRGRTEGIGRLVLLFPEKRWRENNHLVTHLGGTWHVKTLWGFPWFSFFCFLRSFWRVAPSSFCPDPRVEKQSRRQYWSRVPVSTNRGFIYDANGNALALSIPSSSFFLDPAFWNPSDGPKLRGILLKVSLPPSHPKCPDEFSGLREKSTRERRKKYAHWTSRHI